MEISTLTRIGRMGEDGVRPVEVRILFKDPEGDPCKASGELALKAMLSPGPYGGYAKRPLIDRIPRLDPSIPITLVYGDRDW